PHTHTHPPTASQSLHGLLTSLHPPVPSIYMLSHVPRLLTHNATQYNAQRTTRNAQHATQHNTAYLNRSAAVWMCHMDRLIIQNTHSYTHTLTHIYTFKGVKIQR